MKKLLGFVGVLALGTILLSSCTTGEVSSSVASSSVPAVGTITFSGTEAKSVVRGDDVDLLEGVTALDSIDGDISDSITISDDGGFDTNIAGGYTVTYSVTNSTDVTSSATKTFAVSIGHNVANGDFSLAAYNWSLDVPGGAATMDCTSGAATVSITDSGTAWWAIQLYQTNIIFEAGSTYKMSFVDSSQAERSIAAGNENIDNGYSMMNPGIQVIKLSSIATKYEVYYSAKEDITNAKPVIYLGYMLDGDDTAAAVTIDDVNIEEVIHDTTVTFAGIDTVEVISGNNADDIDLMAGITATSASSADLTSSIKATGILANTELAESSLYVTYSIENADGSVAYATKTYNYSLPKEYDYQSINGEFDYGYLGWTKDVNQTNGTGAATFTSDQTAGTVSIELTNASSAGWHIQLYQNGIQFEANETYVYRIRAKADAAMDVIFEPSNPDNGYALVGISEAKVLSLTTSFVTYEFEFTPNVNYSNVKLGLLLGGSLNSGRTVTVDEFTVYKYDAYNEEFTSTNSPWVYDNISGSIDTTNGYVVASFVDASATSGQVAGSNPWNNQLYQNSGSVLVANHSYQVQVYVMSTVARNIRFWIEDANNGYSAIATGENTTFALNANEWKLCTYNVTITENTATTGAKFAVMYGDSGIAGVAHSVSVDYFRISEVTLVG